MAAVPFFNDDNFHELIGDGQVVVHDGIERPLAARPCKIPFGHIVGATAITHMQLIPRSVWPDLIAWKDQNNSWLENVARDKVSCEDQGGLNYCHAFSMIEAARCRYALQGDTVPDLAATSIAGPITNWRNAGADISDDWAQLRDYGACETSFLPNGVVMPPQSRSTISELLSPSSYKAGWQENAKLHCEVEGIDLAVPGALFDGLATACLLNIPCSMALSWWSHAITGGYRLINLGSGKYAARCRNNWGATYGDNGFLDLAESKAAPDWGCIGNLSMTALGK